MFDTVHLGHKRIVTDLLEPVFEHENSVKPPEC